MASTSASSSSIMGTAGSSNSVAAAAALLERKATWHQGVQLLSQLLPSPDTSGSIWAALKRTRTLLASR